MFMLFIALGLISLMTYIAFVNIFLNVYFDVNPFKAFR